MLLLSDTTPHYMANYLADQHSAVSRRPTRRSCVRRLRGERTKRGDGMRVAVVGPGCVDAGDNS